MAKVEATMEELRVELSNLRDDLAAIETSAIFSIRPIGKQDAVKAIRNRIAVIEAIIERNER